MPFIPVPGVGQFVVEGDIGGHRFNNVLHFRSPTYPSPWSQGSITAMCEGIFYGMGVHLPSFQAPNVTYNVVRGVDLTNQTPVEGSSSNASWVGTATGAVSPSLSAMIGLSIGQRFRGGHPRIYLPPGGASSMTAAEDQWNTSFVQNLGPAFAAAVDYAIGQVPGSQHCVPRFTYKYIDDPVHHKWTHLKDTCIGDFVVQAYNVFAPIRHQRRRATAAP